MLALVKGVLSLGIPERTLSLTEKREKDQAKHSPHGCYHGTSKGIRCCTRPGSHQVCRLQRVAEVVSLLNPH